MFYLVELDGHAVSLNLEAADDAIFAREADPNSPWLRRRTPPRKGEPACARSLLLRAAAKVEAAGYAASVSVARERDRSSIAEAPISAADSHALATLNGDRTRVSFDLHILRAVDGKNIFASARGANYLSHAQAGLHAARDLLLSLGVRANENAPLVAVALTAHQLALRVGMCDASTSPHLVIATMLAAALRGLTTAGELDHEFGAGAIVHACAPHDPLAANDEAREILGAAFATAFFAARAHSVNQGPGR